MINKKYKWVSASLAVLGCMTLILPAVFIVQLKHLQEQKDSGLVSQFPVTVDYKNKTITENELVNTYLTGPDSPLQASAFNIFDTAVNIYKWVATTMTNLPIYQNLALAGGGKVVTITPGLRKEQVANSFAKALAWNSKAKTSFLTATTSSPLPFVEGSFFPETYFLELGATPESAQALVNKRFTDEVLSHYGTSTANMVPLNVALTIASLIERETLGNEDMREISGIIWNRIFIGMKLQIDATLQYAKATTKASTVWWPTVLSRDKYIKSPYNTYLNSGLPPAPIANPSVAAILAALNPIKTSCLFYFHDKRGGFHCSDTYNEHVKQLKKYYGQGK